jgi:hypothetical protein
MANQEGAIKISGHIEAEIINREGVDQIILDGRPVIVYEYRSLPSSRPLLVVKYGNLVFTVGTPRHGAAEAPKRSLSQSSNDSAVSTSVSVVSGSSNAQLLEIVNRNREKALKTQDSLIQMVKSEIASEHSRLDLLEQKMIAYIKEAFEAAEADRLMSSKPREEQVQKSDSSASLTSSTPTTMSRSASDQQVSNWEIPDEQRSKYEAVFDAHCSQECMAGPQVRELLLVSKLDMPSLAQVWSLASVRRQPNLNRAEFCIAMHLITKLLAGNTLPKELPASLLSFSSAANAQTQK